MTQKNDGGPAFPSEGEGHGNPKYHSPGMSLRDWFAGQALTSRYVNLLDGADDVEDMAYDAYRIADAMLAARDND